MKRAAEGRALSADDRPVGVRRSERYFAEIESLRGVAISLVFLFHVDALFTLGHVGLRGAAVSIPRAFVASGHTGVSLFFILSGFLLARPFLAQAAGGREVNLGEYYARRALRILPLYYAAVIAAGVLCASRAADLWSAAPYLVFLNGFKRLRPLDPYSSVWWSLATEAQFYLILPLLGALLVGPRTRRVGTVALLVYIATYAAFLAGVLRAPTARGQTILGLSVFGRGPLFLLGAAAAWVYDSRGSGIRARWAASGWIRNGGADAALIGAFAALGWLLSRVVSFGFWEAENEMVWWHLVEGCLWPALPRLGFDPAEAGLGRLGVIAVLALACVGVSAVTYRAIERPFLARKARLDR